MNRLTELYEKPVIENLPSKRGREWHNFSIDVFKHVENYTVPQYGDMPNDQASDFTIEDIKKNLMRYVNRIGSGARGVKESLRDCLKIAHYGCILYSKIKNGDNNGSK